MKKCGARFKASAPAGTASQLLRATVDGDLALAFAVRRSAVAGVDPAERFRLVRRDIGACVYYGERFNGYSHLAGALLALTGAVVLIVLGALDGDARKIVSFAIYGTTLVLLYSVSTIYHSTRGALKRVFRKLDHNAIYLLIAGTYTPFTLVSLRGPWGWSLFGVIWTLALLGIGQEFWLGKRTRALSLVLYVLMGWVALVAMFPLIEALTPAGFAWLAAGGIVYTAGLIFYAYDGRFKHWHGIWHLFVIGGSAAHYFAILFYVA